MTTEPGRSPLCAKCKHRLATVDGQLDSALDRAIDRERAVQRLARIVRRLYRRAERTAAEAQEQRAELEELQLDLGQLADADHEVIDVLEALRELRDGTGDDAQ